MNDLAEVIIPPEELEPVIPEEQLPQVEKPTEKSKVISVDFNPLNTKQTASLDTHESFFTTDSDAWIVLNVGDMNEPTGQYSLALINKEDGSIFQRTGDIVQGVAYYKLLPNEIKHAGRWVGQAVITLANGQTTASRFSFNVSGHILDGKDVREIVIQDFQTLMAQLNDLKDNATNEFSFLKSEIEAFQTTIQENEDERQAAELGRVAAEIIREENYESKVDSAIVAADVVEKVDNKVAELSPTIQQVTAQLAQTDAEARRKREPEDLSATTLGLVTGTGGPINLLSIPQDKSVSPEKTTFIKRGRNKFDGEFEYGFGLIGSPAEYIAYTNTVSLIQSLEEGKTYTISRSDNANRFGIATFIGKPVAGGTPNRTLTASTVTAKSHTFTLQGGENYIVAYISNENLTPTWIQIEEGETATSFVGYDQISINIEPESLPDVSPEMTTFVSKGKNLFDGNYLHNASITNPTVDGSFRVQYDGTGGYIVIFKGEKGETYTISRSGDTDRYGLGTYIGYPGSNANANRFLNSNTNAWLNYTVTLQGDEDHIAIGISSSTQDAVPERFQIEKGTQATSYSKPNAVKIELDPVERPSNGHIVWFGDSVSELKLLPHRVAELANYKIDDVSFAGSVLVSHTSPNYHSLGFKQLVDAIVMNDYSVQETAISNLEALGEGSNKRPNFNTLKAVDWNAVDEVVVLAGTNDFGAYTGLTALETGMDYAISTLLTAYPHIRLRFITPIWRGNGDSREVTLKMYADKILETAKKYNLPALDLYSTSGINQFTKSVFLGGDELHQTDKGDELLADVCSRFLISR